MAAGRNDSIVKNQRSSCLSSLQGAERTVKTYQEKFGKAPADLKSVPAALQEAGVKNVYLQTKCVSDSQAEFVLDAVTGEVSCPHHGTARNPKTYVSPDLASGDREEQRVLRLFGRAVLRLNAGPDGFEVAGRIIPDLTPPASR